MKKEVIVLAIIVLVSTFISAQSIENSIQKMTHYAEEYEIGNINYAQLIVYLTSTRGELEEIMGATTQGHDAVFKAEQLEKALGKPSEYTKWVWVENEEHDQKLDNEIPAWRKIIFDGKKIQIWLGAWPNIHRKNNQDEIIYRLHLDVQFKSIEESINIKEEIERIKKIAEEYSLNPNKENLENLAKESVNVEQFFNSNFNQNPEKCEELMNDIFGNENKRDSQKLLVQEIDFFEGENFDAILRIEMCDDCQWHWISPILNFRGRGGFEYPEEKRDFEINYKERFKGKNSEDFKREAERLIEEIRKMIEQGNFKSAMDKSQELRILNDAWNEKANNVWEEVEDEFRINFESMTEAERQECSKNYCWIKKEQERREAERKLRETNYQERKQFYSNLFSNYEKKEFYYEQEEWEKRLVEEFKEFGEEICSNNVDDNENGQIDCSDSQCGGKICGYDIITITDNNETREEKRELYCIAGSCQAREEIVHEKIAICGNHICEENEAGSCNEDCSTCFEYEAIECNGKVIFSGKDNVGCPLEPICIREEISCEIDEDCVDPLCGDATCVEGKCQVTELRECQEPKCVEGQEKIQHCQPGEEIVSEKCIEGLWVKTNVECQVLEGELEETIFEVVGDECVVKSDCGNEDDVCSNGKCVTIPKIVSEDEIEKIEEAREIEAYLEKGPDFSPEVEQGNEGVTETQNEEIEENSEQGTLTGNVIFSLFRTLANKIRITGFGTEEGTNNSGTSGETNENADNIQEGSEINNENNQIEENKEEFEDNFEDEREDRDREEKERRERECNERCDRECYDRETRPCVEDCIWEQCGNELECNVDEIRVSCENKCNAENNLESCKNECFDKCIEGKETWIEPERKEHKQEKFVFTVGGSCREAQGRTEGFIWFGGWGEEFNDFHLIKNKYYSHGGLDWCERDFKNLMTQRRELEKSFNEEFARWFFEKYVANSANDWEKHISGIFELYWRDVDLSRQLAERSQCLRKSSLPDHQLINFKYETDYGKIEFWEEIKTAKINEFRTEEPKQIISPYMKTWLFPSREFFKHEMKKSMEMHRLPGPPEEERKNTLSEEERREFRFDDEFMENIREFNEKYGENLIIQFKDFESNEIVFNIYIRINENDIMYFEPMLPSENPAENVKVELDVNKLLDIIEYGESGRVELESPPWDRKPRTTFTKNVVDGVRMFFMFNSLINSAVVTPKSAEDDVRFFVENFFKKVMGGDGNRKEDIDQKADEEKLPENMENKEFITGQAIRVSKNL